MRFIMASGSITMALILYICPELLIHPFLNTPEYLNNHQNEAN